MTFLGQNPNIFASPRTSSSPTRTITFPAHLQRLRKPAPTTWTTVILHGYKFSTENELAWVSEIPVCICTVNGMPSTLGRRVPASFLVLGSVRGVEGKAIPVTGHRGPWGCETSRLLHSLDIWLIKVGEIVSLMHQLPITTSKIPGTRFC
jgi:hypothetical protein